ncbi:no hits [hydrothermal vent metagenome]|uniref:No hits n=1 Tax=hydrothermal vent metagenome TaxID=652676 RepID=A0A1W1D0A4_9ZZZZ
MKLKNILITTLLFILLGTKLYANEVSIKTDNLTYTTEENITVHATNMLGDSEDWIAIYPKGSSNDWANVIAWNWTDGFINGSITFERVPVGEYEVRAFFKNSYNLEAKYAFSVLGLDSNVSLQTDKNKYSVNEKISVNFEHMFGDSEDWIGIYPKGSSNDWGNVIDWEFTEGLKNGQITFDELPLGEYEVRAFFKNSYTLEANSSFSVVDSDDILSIVTDKDEYNVSENIVVNFEHMKGEINKDWIAIYPKDSDIDGSNILLWAYTDGSVNGSVTLGKLPIGEYEARAFFNNSYNLEATYPFEVKHKEGNSTIYEDGENGLSPNWIHQMGDYPPIHVDNDGFNSNGALALVTQWVHNTTNLALYYLPLHNTTQKILEMDIGGLSNFHIPNKPANQVGYMSHFVIGVAVHTTDGTRRMAWDSFLNHQNVSAYRTTNEDGSNVWLYYPSPVEHVRGFFGVDIHLWEHFRVDIEEQLKILEPNNKVISVDYLFLTGGFLDNIKLSSN